MQRRRLIIGVSGSSGPHLAWATLQALLDDWATLDPALARRRHSLDVSAWQGCPALEPQQCLDPLPRAYQWATA